MNKLTRDEFTSLLSKERVSSKVKRDLRFVPEEITNWSDLDFLVVTNRSRSEGVLVIFLEEIYIRSFSLQMRKPNKNGRIESIVCDLCMTWQQGIGSAIITFAKKESTVSFLCCADLLCSLHVRDMTLASELSRSQIRENNSAKERVQRLRLRLETVCRSTV